jgi:hypothetical protein
MEYGGKLRKLFRKLFFVFCRLYIVFLARRTPVFEQASGPEGTLENSPAGHGFSIVQELMLAPKTDVKKMGCQRAGVVVILIKRKRLK